VSKALFDKFSFIPSKIVRRRRRRRPAGPSDPFNDGPQTPSRRGTAQDRLPGYDDDDDEEGEDGFSSEEDFDDDDPASFAFEVNLANLTECLNIYGHANVPGGGSTGIDDFGSSGRGAGKKRFGAAGEDGDMSRAGTTTGMIGSGNPNGCTSMLMKWAGPGWPLQLAL